LSTMVIVPGTKAEPYTGSVVLMDGSANEQDYFEPSDTIYFEVTVLDAGVPLQSQSVDMVIYGLAGIGEVFNTSYFTDSYGQFSGYHWDGSWYSHDVGDYVVFVNFTGEIVVQVSFQIYNPVPWTASGWTTFNGDMTDVFSEDQRVEVHVRALDQYSNPFDGNYGDVWFEIIHLGSSVDIEYLSTDSNGEDLEYYYPQWGYEDQFGLYQVTVYNDAVPAQAIGFFNFTVTLPTTAVIQPQNNGQNRTVFTPGENVGYEITLYYLTRLYDSDSYAARLLLFRNGEETPLENDTLRTNMNGVDTDTYYHWIGMGEEDKGTYEMKVYTLDWVEIGSAIFLVIDLSIEMVPHKSVYAQGDEVEILVRTTLDQAYMVTFSDSNHVTVSSLYWNVPAGTNLWGRDLVMPNINDGTYYIDVFLGSLLLDSRAFELKKFTIEARLNQDAFLPGQTATFYWRAIDNHGGGPIDISGTTELDFINTVFNTETNALSGLSGSAGEFQFAIPINAHSGNSANIDVEASDPSGHSDTTDVDLFIGWLDVAIGTDRGYYRPGESVLFSFFSHVDGTSSSVPEVELNAHLEHDGANVETGWSLYTDTGGIATYMYQLSGSLDDGVYRIVVDAVFGQNRAVTARSTAEFTVSSDPILALILYQPKDIYAPGESVSISYRVLRDGLVTTDAEVSFEARLGSTSWGAGGTIAFGFGSLGFITFDLPQDLEGTLLVHAMALTSDGYQAYAELGGSGWGTSLTTVTNAQVLLFSTKSVYMPGENITWVFNLLGDTVMAASYIITDPDGVVLAEGVPVGGSFSYLLPFEYARSVTATLFVTGADRVYSAIDMAPVYEGFFLEYKIKKHSYSPGDQMSINYTIVKIGHGPGAVNGYLIQIMISGEYSETVWVSEETGTLYFQLPEVIKDGKHIFSVSLVDQGDDLMDFQTIIIDSNAGDLAHGTILGLNASAFLVLLFTIAALIIAMVGVAKWRKMEKGKGKESTPPAPPAAPQPVEPVQETVPPPTESVDTQPESYNQDYTPPPPPQQDHGAP